jgi:Maltokinase N-terminal cap domain
MNPTKLDLLAAWLPAQPWYRPTGQEPQLARVGGFRLDDPAGEVGIEFMVVTDGSGDRTVTYQVPMTYRASALDGADEALIGTSEHGVLGHRWLYDGVHDPVLRAQLIALIQGEAEPQAQTVSDTPDLTVTSLLAGTELMAGELSVQICRVLQPGDSADGEGSPCLSATWRLPDGTQARGVFAVAMYSQA